MDPPVGERLLRQREGGGVGAGRPGNSLLQGLASSSLLCPPVLRWLPDPPKEPHRGAQVAARLAGERAAEVHPQEADGGRSDVSGGLPQTQQEDPVLVQAVQSYREAPLGATVGSARGVWFCGITVRIKPAFTQLGSQCFLQPSLCISGPDPRSCWCSRPELLCANSARSIISDILLADICSSLHP